MAITHSQSAAPEVYSDTAVRQFSIMAVVWGVVGMSVGLLIASQLAWPELTNGIPWLSYGRIRPLHTNAVIFAFGGCALMATSFYVVQRTCQVRLFCPPLASFVFWGWQAVIVGAAISLPLGYTTGKEYAELEWPIDILITLVWVAYAIVFFGTVGRRRVRHIYVANWFYGAFIIAVALLQVLLGLCRCARCDGAVVVWPQRGGLLLDGWLPGHDVLLHPQAGRAAGVLVPPVDRALLGADLHLYVGRSAPSALHGAAGLDPVAGHGVLADFAGT